MPIIDIGDGKFVKGFISDKTTSNKKKIDFYLEIQDGNIDAKYKFSILNNRNIANIDILEKGKALKIIDGKLIFRGCVEEAESIICTEKPNLGIRLENLLTKKVYIKFKNPNDIGINNFTEIKHKYMALFDIAQPNKCSEPPKNPINNEAKHECTITETNEKKYLCDINNPSSKNILDANTEDGIVSYKSTDNQLEKEHLKQNKPKEKECYTPSVNKINIRNTNANLAKKITYRKEQQSINIGVNNKKKEDIKLKQTEELLNILQVRSITHRESRINGRDTFAFRIGYFGFKKVSLHENIYYTPIDIIATIFKNQIVQYEKFMICIILKKNSSYIKNIQIGIPAEKDIIPLVGLNNCKYFFSEEEKIGYWLINYEP